MMMNTNVFRSPAGFGALAEKSGLICMALAMLLLPVGDTFAKLMTGALDPVAVTMWRLIAQSVFLLPIAVLMRSRLRGPMFSPVVVLSGVLLCVSLTGLTTAFSMMPIATAIAIFFVEPLILTVLAGPLLGEKAGPRRLIAVGVGLVGALIVIRPGGSAYGWATLLPLMSAFAYALNMIILKRASTTRSSLTMQCGATIYAAGFMLVGAGAAACFGGVDLLPSAQESWVWGIIVSAGAVAALSFILIAEAFRREEATVLAPFQYFEILAATALGYLVFGDFPDVFTWAGLAVILGSGIYIFHREGQTATSAPRRKRAVR